MSHEEHEIEGQTWIVFLLLVAYFKVSENNCLAASEKSEFLSSVNDNWVVLSANILSYMLNNCSTMVGITLFIRLICFLAQK